MDIYTKYELLKDNLKSLGNVAIAFSGGVDSTFLLKTAYDVLGNNTLAVTARSATYPERELQQAIGFAEKHGIPHEIIVSEELEIEGFSDNPTNRCYLCKTELFTKIAEVAALHQIKHVAEGSNHDDLGDYRPGLIAVCEQGVRSPLREAMMTKEDIRMLSKELGISTWNKPSFACLSSRFPYGQKITKESLVMVDTAEQYLMDLGFTQVRVRHHGDIARLEVLPTEMNKFFEKDIMNTVYDTFKKIGFSYVTLDMKGYRTGSMNENLKKRRDGRPC